MRTRAAARREAAAAASASVSAIALTLPSDEDLAAAYYCDDDLLDAPDADPYYYHRLAALDVTESDDYTLFKAMKRGENYLGMEPLVSINVHSNNDGVRSLSAI